MQDSSSTPAAAPGAATGEAAVAAAAAAAASQGAALPSASLYVGDLDPEMAESQLFEIFGVIGPVVSIRVLRDSITRRSLGYAYVNYQNAADAASALERLNGTMIKGRPCRVMWVQRDPARRKSARGNLFIKNLDQSIDHKMLSDFFSQFGPILSCKVALDGANRSKGYGFVHFEKPEDAERAIEEVNGNELQGKEVYVSHFVPRSERGSSTAAVTNLYVKYVREDATKEEIEAVFAEFGAISSLALATPEGVFKGVVYVNFETPEAAKAAVEGLHGSEGHALGQDDKELYVQPFMKKRDRQNALQRRAEQMRAERASKYHGVNLYVKNLDDRIDSDGLRDAFAEFGEITSAKVMRDEKTDLSKGFGFVCFTRPEEASAALSEMNGKMLGAKPLYVALAQRKEERRAQLAAQISRRRRMPPAVFAGQGAPPVYYAQRGGFGVPYPGPPQLMGRGWGQPPGQFPPQPGQFPPQPFPVPMMHPAGPGGPVHRQVVPQPAPAPAPAPQPAPAPAPQQEPLSLDAVAALPAEQRTRALGERLYPLIAASQPERAGKITGMLLERYKDEPGTILDLLQAPADLAQSVEEAVSVLQFHERARAGGDEEDE